MTEDQIDDLITAISNISCGGRVPQGFEALCMALCGKSEAGEGPPGEDGSIAAGLHSIGDGLRDVASAITFHKTGAFISQG